MTSATACDFRDVLRACGVTDSVISPSERDALDQEGWVVFPRVIDERERERLCGTFEAAVSRPNGGGQAGTRHVEGLAGGDEAFDSVFAHSRVLAAVHHVLARPLRVFLLGGRDPLPGYWAQGLHNDWMPRATKDPFAVVTALWLLDDFTERNGATRVVPGSHLVARSLPKSMQTPDRRHPDEMRVVAEARSVLVFNGHLWHGGTRNDSTGSRRVLQCEYVARCAMRPPDSPPTLPDRLSPAARILLGG